MGKKQNRDSRVAMHFGFLKSMCGLSHSSEMRRPDLGSDIDNQAYGGLSNTGDKVAEYIFPSLLQ